MSDAQVLTARWIFPVAQPPIQHGTITIQAGKIIAVHSAGSRSADIDFGNAAIIPGLVNTHTHLDLSGLRGKVPPSSDFTGWLKQIIAHRRAQTPEQIQHDIRAGLDEALAYGTTLIGDITAGGASWLALSEAPSWSVCFHELIGLSRGRADEQLSSIRDWLSTRPTLEHCRGGLTPHAPYSVHRSIFSGITNLPHPIAIHLAESPAEIELLEKHEGPFVAFLSELGIWNPDCLSADYANMVRHYAAPTLLVHANYMSTSLAIPENATIAYCPRTHLAFGHESHPFREWMRAGVRVVLATDSLASNPDLDVFTEAQFVFERYPDVPPESILRMVTLSGAEALGFESVTGSLSPGKSADLVVMPLPDQEAEPFELLFKAPRNARKTMWRGLWR
jgi:cytosine/adenosine deaminase-related metal-dependent hydrolase